MIRLALAGACAASLVVPSLAAEIGAPLPDFEATALDGTRVSLAAATTNHKAVVVMFLSTVCPYSRFYADHMRELAAAYGPKGVLFIGVNSNRTETADEALAFAREHGHTFPLVKDAGNRVADILGARLTPEAFLVDAEGRLRYRGRVRSKIGTTDLKDAIEAVLDGRPVRRAEAKAFGCTIVRE